MKIDTNNQTNPIVLLSNGIWHIVEHSRQSTTGLCSKSLKQRQAHSRLKTIGRQNTCPRCLHLFDEITEH